jgi:COP9 signalosome complex subunit 1
VKYARLQFIGAHSVVFAIDALKAAAIEAKKGKNTEKYMDSLNLLRAVAPDEREAVADHAWLDNTASRNKAETLKLENELKQYRNNLIKESIRVS